MKKRITSIVLVLCIVLMLVPFSANAMSLYVDLSIIGQATLTLEVESGDSVANVKGKIEAETGLSKANQILKYKGKALEDGRTLADYNIQKYSTIKLFLAEGDVNYRCCNENGADWKTGIKAAGEYIVVASTITTWNEGWYVVNRDVTIDSRVAVSGNVHLILADGCTLTASGGIQVQDNDNSITNGSANTLTIYAQSTGDTMGKLTVPNLTSKDAGIGGNGYNFAGGNGGVITINGGAVTAGSTRGAGIGGGSGDDGGSGGTIIINGGMVTAGSTRGAGIGGGDGGFIAGSGGNVTINGGTVTAKSESGAGIGGGYAGDPGGGIGNSGTFSTGTNGKAVIVASSIADKTNQGSWRGVIFEENAGSIYGTSVAPSENFTVESGKTLTIGVGQTLTVLEGVTLTNNGTVHNKGIINNNGTITGSISGNRPKVSAEYLDTTGKEQTVTGTTEVTDDNNQWTTGWYVVNRDVTIDRRIAVSGNVHLILADGCTLTANGGIQVQDNDNNITNGSINALTIYAQSTGNTTGKLTVPELSSGDAAIGGDSSGDDGGSGGVITINGGIVEVYGNLGAGIGGGGSGGKGGNGGTVTINGGTVTAKSLIGAGIGGGFALGEGIGGDGGIVTVDSTFGTGIGGGNSAGDLKGSNGVFSTGTNGKAVIVASSIADKTNQGSWSGVIFEGNAGSIYGTSAAPSENFTIESGKTLTIGVGQVLTVLEGMTLTNKGTITNSGKIYVDGTLTGTADNLYYHLTLENATAPENTSVYNGKTYAKAESRITLTPDTPPTGFIFDKWDISLSSVAVEANNSFTMPRTPLKITARWKDVAAPVIAGIENGKAYCLAPTVSVSDNDVVESVTVNGNPVTWEGNHSFTLPAAGTHTIVAADKAGNKAEMTVTVNNGHVGGKATCKAKAICQSCGEEYGEIDSSNHTLEEIPEKAATVTETGNKAYWHCEDCGNNFSDKDGKNSIELKDTVIAKLAPEMIKGAGQCITVGEKKELTFRSNAAFSDFIRVELNGKTLDETKYTVKKGSTVVTLKADFVSALSVGEYTLGIVSASGTAAAAFTVNARSPQTGDYSHINIILWIALFFVSGGLLTVTVVYCKKKKYHAKRFAK